MRLSFLWLLLFAGMLAGASEIPAVRAEKAPVIDGKLDDAAWQNAPAVKTFYANKGGSPAAVPTEARFLYDNNAVYVGVRATMPAGSKIITNDKNLYAGECVELMLDPGATRNVYYHFMTNPNAVQFDAVRDQGGFVGNPKWDALWQCAAATGDGFWSCEFKIPYAALDFPANPGRDWTVNVTRGARGLSADGAQEDSAIATDGAYHVSGKFPDWKGFDVDFSRYAWRLGVPDVVTFQDNGAIGLTGTVSVANTGTKPLKAKVAMRFFAPDGAAQSKSVSGEFVPGSNETLKFDGFKFQTPGQYRCEILISDFATKQVLKRKEYPVTVQFNPVAIELTEPWYKNAIFATMKLDQVRGKLKFALPEAELTGKKLTVGIRTPDGKVVAEKSCPAANGEFAFPTAALPEGKLVIFAKLTAPDGATVAEATHPLRKLPYFKDEVWLNKDRTIMVDGKPFFMIGQWTSQDDFIPGVNAFLDWNSYRGAKVLSPVFTHNATMDKLKKQSSISAAEEAEVRKLVASEMNKPNLLAYYFCDEPEVFGDTVEALTALYQIIDDADPYHPLILSNDTIHGIIDYADAGDINGLHPYPRPDRKARFNDFGKALNYLDAFNDFFAQRSRKQALTWLAQGFDYSNYAAVDTRIPRYLELRNQHLLSLITGGKGVILYNTLNDHDPEIGIGLVEHVKELEAYGPALLEPASDLKPELSLPDFRILVKQHDGELWLFVANAGSADNRELAITLPELGNRKLKVMAENRTVEAKNGILRDRFNNFDVHVYTTDMSAPDLRGCDDIEAEIERVHAARKKPGNLAYQRHEGETVKVSASSNMAFNVRPDNCLWHVADGMIEPENFKRYNDRQVVWSDKTPNAAPDWIELDFKKPVTAGRVIVYPVENTLKDYQVQIWKNNVWSVVAEAKDASGNVQEHTFAPTATDKVRIFITGTRGPHARISEIEVYEK